LNNPFLGSVVWKELYDISYDSYETPAEISDEQDNARENYTQHGELTMGILDLDLDAITDPNDPAPAGTYRLALTGAELKESDSGSVGVLLTRKILNPGEQQGKQIREYVNIQKKDGSENKFGTFQIKTLLALKKVKKGSLRETIPQLVGLEHDAEVDIDIPEPDSDREAYGPQNTIKRILK
jgi:hypothetical protein